MSESRIRRIILRYSIGLAAGAGVVQTIIAAQGHRITLVSTLALFGVGLCYLWANLTGRRTLMRVHYGTFISHFIGYVVIVGSYWLHAGYLMATGRAETLDTSWYGVLLGMGVGWGIGLLVHAAGALSSQGYEDATI